jgi:hypothetical protein
VRHRKGAYLQRSACCQQLVCELDLR